MKIALVGYGYWGKKIYKTLKNSVRNIELLVVDPKIKKQTDLKLRNLDEILGDSEVTHCIIATPEETHFQIAKSCLLHNKNVFVEKPLSLESVQAKKLIAIAKKNRRKLFVDYIFLYDSYVQKIKRLIDKETIGELLNINSIRYSVGINKPNISVFEDLATHDIYLSEYFFNKKISIIKVLSSPINSKKINNASANYFIDKNMTKSFQAHYSWSQPVNTRIMIFNGKLGSLIWDKNEKNIILYRNQKKLKEYTVTTKNSSLQLSLEDFLLHNKKELNYVHHVQILEKLKSAS